MPPTRIPPPLHWMSSRRPTEPGRYWVYRNNWDKPIQSKISRPYNQLNFQYIGQANTNIFTLQRFLEFCEESLWLRIEN